MTTDGWNLYILDMLKWIDNASIRSLRDIIIVDNSLSAFLLVVDGILNDCTESDGIINIGLFLS